MTTTRLAVHLKQLLNRIAVQWVSITGNGVGQIRRKPGAVSTSMLAVQQVYPTTVILATTTGRRVGLSSNKSGVVLTLLVAAPLLQRCHMTVLWDTRLGGLDGLLQKAAGVVHI